MPDQVDWRAIERDTSSGRAVGRLLRDQREARGLALSDVEKALRIRCSSLEAIEEGRFDKLPGAAYVPAFLRAYAAHVGLDPDKVLTAYHHSGAVPIKRPVALPADFPIAERRAPVGLAVLTVLLVVAAGYAAWHYLPREQAVVVEKVPPVPDRLLASRPDAAPTGSAAPPTVSAPAPAPGTTTSPQPSREVRNSPPAAQPAELWPAMRRDSVAPPTQPESQPAPLAPPVVVQVPAPPAVMTVPAIGQAQAAQPPIQVDTPKAATSVPATEEAVAKPAAPDPATSNIPVKVDTPVRVRTNSWVELRSPTGDVLAQTYVRAGESYTVPAGIAYRVIDAR
ncbi:helix-turn-helix domain-containing protein [Reyranella sp.]|uniref:helix-turn-helix domain-containing protein n=1 Tax=Reyranella sp. TaxID=1929291 RepID=UPI0037851D6E